MPLAPVSTKNVSYKGCPPDCRHVVFARPDGREAAAFLPIDPSWDVSLFVEEDIHRFFMVATSPDQQGLRIERWLSHHGPKRITASTQAEQGAALGGKHAGNATPAELADAAVASLTAGDQPAAVPPRGTDLLAMAAPNPNGAGPREKRGDYEFQTVGPAGQESLVIRTFINGPLSGRMVKTSGTEATLLAVFCNVDSHSAYFLFNQGTDYLLESLDWWAGGYRRQEAVSAQAPLGGLSHEDVVKAMVPNLVKS